MTLREIREECEIRVPRYTDGTISATGVYRILQLQEARIRNLEDGLVALCQKHGMKFTNNDVAPEVPE